MNIYDIESLNNRINLMENELEMLKHWVDLLIKESTNVMTFDSTSTKKIYDDTVTSGKSIAIITD